MSADSSRGRRGPLSLSLLANQYPALHGVRVLGVFLIVQLHTTNAFVLRGLVSRQDPWTALSMGGWVGMDLFFVLSGFLIGSILLHAQQSQRDNSVWRFYLRRSFRIIPAYYVVLTLVVLIRSQGPIPELGIFQLTDAQWGNLIREYLYLTNYTRTSEVVLWWGWSLAVEEHFYIAVPLVIYALTRLSSTRARLLVVGAGWLSALLVRLTLVLTHGDWGPGDQFQVIYIPTHARYDLLLVGIFLAIIQRDCQPFITRVFASPAMRRALPVISILAFVSIVSPQAAFQLGAMGPEGGPQTRYLVLFNAFAIGTLTTFLWVPLSFYLLNGAGRFIDFMGAMGFLRLATLGYGIYLLHVPCLAWIAMPLSTWALGHAPVAVHYAAALAITCVMSVVTAYLLHLLVEKPSLALRDRFAA